MIGDFGTGMSMVGGDEALVGSSTAASRGVATASATLGAPRPLTATSHGSSTATVIVLRLLSVSASSTGVSSATSNVRATRTLTSSVFGNSVVTVTTLTTSPYFTIIRGTSAVTARAVANWQLAATAASTSTVRNTAMVGRGLAGTSAGLTSVASIINSRPFSGAIHGISSALASFTRTAILSAQALGSAVGRATGLDVQRAAPPVLVPSRSHAAVRGTAGPTARFE